MTSYTKPWSYCTRLTAPSTPGIPHVMPAPSNAGPDATAQQVNPPRPPSAISPFGADIEKQMFARQLRQSGGQQAGRDISADITRHAGG